MAEMTIARRQVFRFILAVLLAMIFSVLVRGQEDALNVEYEVKSLGNWQVPVKILEKRSKKRSVQLDDYEDGLENLSEDEPSNLIKFEVPKGIQKAPQGTRHFTGNLNLAREMLNSFRRRQLESSPMLAVNKDNFRPLCQVEQALVEFQHADYEYRPRYYHELSCKKAQSQEVDDLAVHGKCALPLLHCVQIYQEFHIARRRMNSTCWEPQMVVVKAGCECMWPEHELGSPDDHY